MKKEWFVSYKVPDEMLSFIGPVKGSRETARQIRHLLEKANPEITEVHVVESQAPGSFSTEAKDFMVITEAQLKQAIHVLGANEDKTAVGIIRYQMRQLQQFHQEAESILRALNRNQ